MIDMKKLIAESGLQVSNNIKKNLYNRFGKKYAEAGLPISPEAKARMKSWENPMEGDAFMEGLKMAEEQQPWIENFIKEGEEKERKPLPVGEALLSGLIAADFLTPNRKVNSNTQSMDWANNINSQGTGSQAIAKAGYEMGGDPIKQMGRKQDGMIAPSSDVSQNKAYTAEMLSYYAGQGVNPVGTKGASSLLTQATEAFGVDTARGLINSMVEFTGRDDVKGMSKEQRVNSFYDLMSRNPKVGGAVSEMRNIGYGPTANLQGSPDVDLANFGVNYLEPVESKKRLVNKKSGGKVKSKK